MLVKKLMALGGYTKAEDLERDYPTMESFVEAFPQAQVYINQYKKQMGGGQQDPLMQVITAVAQQAGIDPQQLASMLQQSPEFLTQLSQMAAQDPNQAAKALMQVLQNASQGQQQAQAQPSEQAQPGQMPMNPEEAMQMAYNGGSKLSKFIRKTGGDIAFPQAAPMYDNSIYRTFPPNMPRLFQDGGSLPSFQGDQGPSETGTVLRQDPSTGYPVVNMPPVEISAQAYRPPMLMPPPQAQYAEMNPWIPTLGALGLASAYLGAGRTPFQGKVDTKMIEKSQMATEKGLNLNAKQLSAYSNFSDPLIKKSIRRYNITNGTAFSTLGELPKEARDLINQNIATLYDIKSKSPKQFNQAQRLMDMYPETALADAAKEHMGKSAIGRSKARMKSKIEGMPKGVRTFGTAAGLAGLGALLPYAAYKLFFEGDPDQTEEAASPYSKGTELNDASDTGTFYQTLMNAANSNSQDSPIIDGSGNIQDTGPVVNESLEDEKYGGNIYAYGGGTPFGYGYFAPPMAYGGNSTAMPGIDNVDSQLQMRNNAWLDYVRNNVKNAAMPQSFRKGGAKKKKG